MSSLRRVSHILSMPKKKKTSKKAVLKNTKSAKKKSRKIVKPSRAVTVAQKGVLVARVSHYFDKIKVAAFKLKAPLKKGDTIRIEGGETMFKQNVVSMQIDHEAVTKAKKGDEVGIRVSRKAREGYRVYKI